MLALIVAGLVAGLAAAGSPTVLESSMPWWERITVTVDDKGKQQSCQYEISLAPNGARACDSEMAAGVTAAGSGPSGVFSKVTFERRFSPGSQLDSGRLPTGDTLLGRQVMYLTFDARGAIDSCRVVAATGDMAFHYDCDEARKEQFRAHGNAASGSRPAFMTVLAYGHSEQMA